MGKIFLERIFFRNQARRQIKRIVKDVAARSAFNILDDLYARALRYLSHLPLLNGYHEPEILP